MTDAEEIFEQAYQILVSIGGADPHREEAFRRFHMEHHAPNAPTVGTTSKWRFGGLLGGGGKFYVTIESFHVDYYPEDVTPTRHLLRQRLNEFLKPLHKAWFQITSQQLHV